MLTMIRTLSARVEARPKARLEYAAPAALLGAGLLLAVTTNLAKVAQGSGVTPLAYLTWSLAGAAVLLATVALVRGQMSSMSLRSLEYYIVAGFLTVAGTNLIFFTVVTRLGVGFVALMLSLPPVLTYAGALMLRMEKFCRWRAAGVTLALAGTALLVLRKWAAPDADPAWIALALIGPVLLAAGNIYRTRRWPPGASAQSLAPGMLLGAIVFLVLFSQLPGFTLGVPDEDSTAVRMIALQSLVFAGQFLLLFVLQKAGGPVFLSLMGGVGAIFGVPIATILLAEPLLPAFLPSASLIAAGIVCMLLGVRTCQGRSVPGSAAVGDR